MFLAQFFTLEVLQRTPLKAWADELLPLITFSMSPENDGNISRWDKTLSLLPTINTEKVILDAAAITLINTTFSAAQKQELTTLLQQLRPWRKGPFDVFGIKIETEWRSDWKWDRLKNEISSLQNRHVLDVGCGNGYHCWRMLGAGAKHVIGIDPSRLFVSQFLALKHFIGAAAIDVLPLTLEQLPPTITAFDSVFSMGVLYHRRSPFEHLQQLRGCLQPGGELILETLVVDGDANTVLVPKGRYANMRNVWFLPSCLALEAWLLRAGFENVRCIDVTKTSIEEQHATDWMNYQSLSDFLDSDDQNLTIEGLPAPKRAIFIANKPL
ncbi:MAG: tRNA 5-methoxyuridine(34)/uridine 5-oxyacetic acid(34) synthase CmoB [Gammaproteobacteria bacterium]|nr:tRNA 5-methoxyuridine(34)/uridine 5-oxyacetic acid(34) synthase CmoB [Gammaproteobacteria bacterium]